MHALSAVCSIASHSFFFFFLVGGVVLFLQPHDKHATEIGLIFLGGLEIFFLDTSRN